MSLMIAISTISVFKRCSERCFAFVDGSLVMYFEGVDFDHFCEHIAEHTNFPQIYTYYVTKKLTSFVIRRCVPVMAWKTSLVILQISNIQLPIS